MDLTGTGQYRFLVHGQYLAVPHQEAALHHGIGHIPGVDRFQQGVGQIRCGQNMGLIQTNGDQVRQVSCLYGTETTFITQCRRTTLGGHPQDGAGWHDHGIGVGYAHMGVHDRTENLHFVPQRQAAVGSAVRSQTHTGASLQEPWRIRHALAAVGEGTVHHLDTPLRHQVDLVIAEQDAVGRQKMGAQYAQPVQVFHGAQPVPFQAGIDLVGILADVGMDAGLAGYETILRRELDGLDEEFSALQLLSQELAIRARGLRFQKAA